MPQAHWEPFVDFFFAPFHASGACSGAKSAESQRLTMHPISWHQPLLQCLLDFNFCIPPPPPLSKHWSGGSFSDDLRQSRTICVVPGGALLTCTDNVCDGFDA